jgi:hypothetical protein
MFIKKMMMLFTLIGLVTAPIFASAQSTPNQGVFTSVDGKVKVKTKKGHKTKTAKKDLTVFEGDRVITSENSKATIRLFDGSSLDVAPKTEFVLSKLQKPDAQDKVIKFKLIVGELLAAVEKLTTSKSSFEIEAGGVVCGVRGTKFSMNCDGKHNPQVQLHVFEGIVYTIDGKGNRFLFHPGPPIKFVNAQQSDNNKPNNPPGGNNNNDKNTGLNDLNGQFQSNIGLNQNKTLSTTQGGTNITIKPVVGN